MIREPRETRQPASARRPHGSAAATGYDEEWEGVVVLRTADHPRGLLTRRHERGELQRLTRGAFITPAPPEMPQWQQVRRMGLARLRAVAQEIPSSAAIGYWHAALALGAPVRALPAKVDVAAPRGYASQPAIRGFTRHRRQLRAEDVVVIDGIRVTSPVRTAVDCARSGDPANALPVVDFLLRKLASVDRFDRAASFARMEHVRSDLLRIVDRETRTHGNRAARAILRHADGFAESALESEVRRCCLVLGLPAPELQAPVRIDGRIVYPDLTWRFTIRGRTRIVHVEADGRSKYEPGLDLDREREREAEIRGLDHTLVRLSGTQVYAGGAARVRSLLFPALPQEILATLDPDRELMTAAERARL